jgi:hypothetical protein
MAGRDGEELAEILMRRPLGPGGVLNVMAAALAYNRAVADRRRAAFRLCGRPLDHGDDGLGVRDTAKWVRGGVGGRPIPRCGLMDCAALWPGWRACRDEAVDAGDVAGPGGLNAWLRTPQPARIPPVRLIANPVLGSVRVAGWTSRPADTARTAIALPTSAVR